MKVWRLCEGTRGGVLLLSVLEVFSRGSLGIALLTQAQHLPIGAICLGVAFRAEGALRPD